MEKLKEIWESIKVMYNDPNTRSIVLVLALVPLGLILFFGYRIPAVRRIFYAGKPKTSAPRRRSYRRTRRRRY